MENIYPKSAKSASKIGLSLIWQGLREGSENFFPSLDLLRIFGKRGA